MKKFGMGTLIALTVAGFSLATLGGCEKKKDTAKPAEKKAEPEKKVEEKK